jgi:hypothetical protein
MLEELTHVLIIMPSGVEYIVPIGDYLREGPPAHSRARMMSRTDAALHEARRMAVSE